MATQQSEFYEALGRAICKARQAAGLTQVQLAVSLGLSRPSVVNIERGRQAVQVHLLVHIAAIVGRPITELIAATRTKPNTAASEQKLQALEPSARRWVEEIMADDSNDDRENDGR